MTWWQTFFDADYLRLWGTFLTPERTAAEVAALVDLLDIRRNTRVLDAPCGSGRIARGLAERGAIVLGIDQSAELIAEAERTRGDITEDYLRYRRQDLRNDLDENDFDVALNIFSSLGYGDELDDVSILTTLGKALHSGGTLVVETNHRDNVVAKLARGDHKEHALPDGSRFWEDIEFDPVRGRVESTWHWSGPLGEGKKHSSLRVYSVTEMVKLVERAGFAIQSVNAGLTKEPYKAVPPQMGSRLVVIATRS
ncbi:MAG TPA: class I SAM-dependent methyltransferase [Kofleriaceae bacterium]